MKKTLALILLVAFSIAADDKPQDSTKDAKKALIGSWTIVKMYNDGKEVNDKAIGKFVVTEKEFQITHTNNGNEQSVTFTWSIDTTKKPHHLTLIGGKGSPLKKVMALYQLKGDTLTIAHGMTDIEKTRPKSLKPEKQSIVAELKRKK